ncbi:hypothetical protein STCU_04934 [Strigomonas culicis]|uniref:G domain-containing protein n=1 Tax=Strigomonas culicis TaxID=28005 RepID=S9VNW7_9TRYP|nr:hypothetical protein STCU_04934 [Strigomonas culicis]|eukprot:EPY28681.1 hypothetical protein STCU_04934 [Strigomonas culicis]
MGWTEDLVELDAERAADTDTAEAPLAPQLVRQKMSNLTERMKYGVLLDAYESDKFALEHRIELAGSKLERKFLEWEGVHVLDQDAGADMAHALAHKAAIVMEAPAAAKIPVVNRDCCPGCGALLQDRSADDFGYVAPGEVERYVKERDEKAAARAEYATRMAELQAHWAKHDRQVGEEWLDFMTQDEFDAYYRDRREPFVCHRCHALENLGVTGRRKVWSAPDFTAQLTALREKKCVVVLVVDITDFPGSMVYDLPGLISMNNDVIIAVNKMDCVRNRSFQYKGQDRAVAARLVSERYVRQWVLDIAVQFGLPRRQIRQVVPISAKRGWNIDKLIAAVEDAANYNLRRPHQPLPTYFAGVANVGKSSVINAFAHYLYVPQPPHPKSTKVYYTKTDPQTRKEVVLWRWYTPPDVNRAEMFDLPAHHDKKASKLLTTSSLPGTTVAVNAVRLALTRGRGADGGEAFLYDTPGLLPHWHRASPLTLLQMRRTLMRRYRNPQCFILVPGHTLFLGGLAAVDVVKGPAQGLLFLVYTSHKVRNGIVRTAAADQFWAEQLGKQLEPPGSYEQLAAGCADGTAPSLSVSRSYLFECYHKHRRRPKADLYVCGLGWVAFCVAEASDVVLRVRTLPGVVHGVREPLRYNDLRAYRAWPRLRRTATSKSLDDAARGMDDESVNTVVQLTAGASADATAAPPEEEAQGAAGGGHFTTVGKARHPHHAAAADAPLGALLEELQHSGKL